jgi:hypothetical protein
MRSMQVERAGSFVVETSVDFVSLFVFAQKNCVINLSMRAMISVCSVNNRWPVGRYPPDRR